MATRVHLFLEENEYKLTAWEGASAEMLRCVADHRTEVLQGRNRNHADLSIHCGDMGLSVHFSIGDLRQEESPMLDSLQSSVDEYDFWDNIPPFGVVELYNIRLERSQNTGDAEIMAFCHLLDRFLCEHFMMYVVLESEIAPIHAYMLNRWRSCNAKSYVHNGETGYRVKSGW